MLSQKAVYFFIFKLFLKLSEIVNISDQQLDILLDEGPVKVLKKKSKRLLRNGELEGCPR